MRAGRPWCASPDGKEASGTEERSDRLPANERRHGCRHRLSWRRLSDPIFSDGKRHSRPDDELAGVDVKRSFQITPVDVAARGERPIAQATPTGLPAIHASGIPALRRPSIIRSQRSR